MLTADGEKSKSPKRAKVRFLLATLTYTAYAVAQSILLVGHVGGQPKVIRNRLHNYIEIVL